MTDEQIIKAYERCFTLGFDASTCYECPFYTATAKCTEDLRDSALALINRQKAEIERLKKKNTILSKNADTAFQDGLDENRDLFKKEVEPEIRNEAIKEFAENLKEEMRLDDGCKYDCAECHYDCKDYIPFIDNLVKEMTEASNR